MRKITVLYDQTSYTYKWLKPLFWSKEELNKLGYWIEYSSFVDYIPSFNRNPESKIKREISLIQKSCEKKFDIVFMAYHHSNSYLGSCSTKERTQILSKLKSCCNLLVWLDTADSTGTCLFDVMPYIDLYFKKQLLKDKSLYLKEVYGGRTFCDYYYKKLKIEDEMITNRKFPACTNEDLKKLRMSWNVGIGDLFSNIYNLRLFPHSMQDPQWIDPNSEKFIDIHFRGSGYSPIAGYQRDKCKQLMQNTTIVTHPDVNKMVPHDEYEREVKNSKAILSPFGWGEICGRDFEALVNGAVLIKPSMEHCETYPNIYQAGETYIPLDWDFENFDEVIEGVKSGRFLEIAIKGQNFFKETRSSVNAKKEFAAHVVSQLEM